LNRATAARARAAGRPEDVCSCVCLSRRRSVWQRDDGSFAVVQMWTTNYNASFKSNYDIWETNPDKQFFSEQATAEFQRACLELFGGTADECPVLFCHREARNDHRVYVGTPATLLSFLRRQPDVAESFNIVELLPTGFVSGTLRSDGGRGTKPFHMAAGEEYVLYEKQGWHTMACATPLWQFIKDRDFLPD